MKKRSGGLCAIFWQVVRTSMTSIECYFNEEYAANGQGGNSNWLCQRSSARIFSQHVASAE